MDPTEQTSESSLVLPPILRAELSGPPPPRRPWYRGIGPAYLGVFVWAPFFDSLWARDLAGASPAGLVSSAIIATLLSALLFYLPTASWGFRARQGLPVVAASTFGTLGSEWIAGLAVGTAELVWFAAAIDWAIEATFLGLAACGLMEPAALGRWELGPLVLRTPVFLCTAVFWIFITGMAALLRLAGVIVALMRVFTPVALLLLTGTALWLLPGVADYHPEDVRLVVREVAGAGQGGGGGSVLPFVLNYFALAGLLAVDWGAGSRRKPDLLLGGGTGIVLGGSWTAAMALLAVMGAVGRLRVSGRLGPAVATAADPPPLSFRWALIHGIGGAPAGVLLILFGLAALAPACWCSWLFLRRFVTHWPVLRRLDWMCAGGAVALLVIATSRAGRFEAIARVMGWNFAPVIGALAGDSLRRRGAWAGVRNGIHLPGLVAWAAGLAIPGVLEVAGEIVPVLRGWLLPSPIAGFLTALVVYGVVTALGRHRPVISLSGLAPGGSRTGLGPVDLAVTGGIPEIESRSEP